MSDINLAFRGAGTFLYDHVELLNHKTAQQVADSLKSMHMQHAWMRVNGRRGVYKEMGKACELADCLRSNGIEVAGWGWFQGENYDADVAAARKGCKAIGVNAYVINAEQGVNRSSHGAGALGDATLHLEQGGLDLGISSFGLIQWHDPKLLEPMTRYCQVVCPQIYWWTHPNANMRSQFGKPKDKLHDPWTYARYCLDGWRQFDKPIVITGQAYWDRSEYRPWGEDQALHAMTRAGEGIARADSAYTSDIVGWNWWWARLKDNDRVGGLSDRMVDFLSRDEENSALAFRLFNRPEEPVTEPVDLQHQKNLALLPVDMDNAMSQIDDISLDLGRVKVTLAAAKAVMEKRYQHDVD